LYLLKEIVLPVFIIITLVNFIFFEPVTRFSSRVLGIEAGFTLFYCLLYYLNLLMQDEILTDEQQPIFWMVTGISIYMVVNFPIFLFYQVLAVKFKYFAVGIWDIHNIAYCVLGVFIARYFYAVRRQLY